MLRLIKELHAQGKLTEAQELILAETKPREELYDVPADPHEVKNLAQSPEHQEALKRLRELLDYWLAYTRDMGLARTEP